MLLVAIVIVAGCSNFGIVQVMLGLDCSVIRGFGTMIAITSLVCVCYLRFIVAFLPDL